VSLILFCVKLLLCTIFFLGTIHAKEIRWTRYGVRPLGMGNAFVAVVDDFNALFYNPAGLAKLKSWDSEILSFGTEVSNQGTKLIQYALQGKLKDPKVAKSLFQDSFGKPITTRIRITPYLIFPGFGLALDAQVVTGLIFGRQLTVSGFDLSLKVPDISLPIAYAHNFLEDRLSIGIGLKLLATAAIDQRINSDMFSSILSESKQENFEEEIMALTNVGVAVGWDFGLLFTPVETMEPTFGLSIMDIGDTKYHPFKSAQAPKDRPMSINTGVSLKPYQTEQVYLMLSMDMHVLNWAEHYSKKHHFGFEYSYRDLIKLQTGLHQGEYTAGLQFDIGLLCLKLSTYKVQFGEFSGEPSMGNRRYIAQLRVLI